VRDDRERLADVLAAIGRIRRYAQDDRTRFDTDELLQNAVLHWIEIIGEAARGVSDKVRDAHPEVPWRVITDMRNRVSHGYFDIDLDVVWNTVTRDLPELQESVIRILAELDSEAENSQLQAPAWSRSTDAFPLAPRVPPSPNGSGHRRGNVGTAIVVRS
jgi:uncharacterized protein with HEPN domain